MGLDYGEKKACRAYASRHYGKFSTFRKVRNYDYVRFFGHDGFEVAERHIDEITEWANAREGEK